MYAGIPWSRGWKMSKKAGKSATTLVYDGILRSRGREMSKKAGKGVTTPVCGGILRSRGRKMAENAENMATTLVWRGIHRSRGRRKYPSTRPEEIPKHDAEGIPMVFLGWCCGCDELSWAAVVRLS